MQYVVKILLVKTLLCSIFVSSILGANPSAKIPEVDEKLIDIMLSRLIYGVKWR